MGQNNCESEKKGKSNHEHGKHQLKIWYTNTDVSTINKLHELSSRITAEFPDIICIAEVKHKNFKRTLSLVELNIVGYNTEVLNVVPDTGRGMLLFIKKDIKYKLVDISLFTDTVPQEVIACEVVTNKVIS